MLAAACASKVLFLKCTVFITRDTRQDVIEFLKREDAEVVIQGNTYSEGTGEGQGCCCGQSECVCFVDVHTEFANQI